MRKFLIKKVTNYADTNSIGVQFRKKRIKPLISMINDVFDKNGCVNIVDIGGTKEYWNIVSHNILEKKKVHITIINLPGSKINKNEDHFSFIEGDGCNLSNFHNNVFDIAHSNSVIEHVGDWNRMIQFSKEISRLAPKYYVQTPNYWFPIEPHCMTPFFHWLPRPLRVSLTIRFNLANQTKSKTVDSAMCFIERIHLLDKKMFQELFKDAEIIPEKFFLMNKSFIATRR